MVSYIHNQFRGTRRSDLNEDKFSAVQNSVLTYLNYGLQQIYPDELPVDEFICPLYDDFDVHGRVTTSLCEYYTCHESCLKYKAQKALEVSHPEVDWEHTWLSNPDDINRIKLIKKGLLILPKDDKKT